MPYNYPHLWTWKAASVFELRTQHTSSVEFFNAAAVKCSV